MSQGSVGLGQDFLDSWIPLGCGQYDLKLSLLAAVMWALWNARNKMAIEGVFVKSPTDMIFKINFFCGDGRGCCELRRDKTLRRGNCKSGRGWRVSWRKSETGRRIKTSCRKTVVFPQRSCIRPSGRSFLVLFFLFS
jgi:hypothetical protein